MADMQYQVRWADVNLLEEPFVAAGATFAAGTIHAGTIAEYCRLTPGSWYVILGVEGQDPSELVHNQQLITVPVPNKIVELSL